jgi:hypothetical protein
LVNKSKWDDNGLWNNELNEKKARKQEKQDKPWLDGSGKAPVSEK